MMGNMNHWSFVGFFFEVVNDAQQLFGSLLDSFLLGAD